MIKENTISIALATALAASLAACLAACGSIAEVAPDTAASSATSEAAPTEGDTADRAKQVDFSDPYYYASIVSLVKTDSAYASATLALALIGTFLGCVIGFAVGVLQTIPIDKNRDPLPAGLSGAR